MVIAKEATKEKLKQVITEIKRNLHNVDHHKQSFDLLGHFYGEFLKYSGGDKKGLGIVLTPNHITSLFARIANLEYGDSALDTCTGTAGFLIAAMAQMTAKYEANPDDSSTIKQAKQERLDKILKDAFLGIEFDENNYTLACANMLLRGDGKSNIKHGNCFDKAFNNIESATFGKPKVTFLNPPYSQKKKDEHELDFIIRACELTKQGGTVIAIVPMSCVCEQKKETVAKRALLLEKNSLTAVMSMPDGLFPTVGTVTCIMVLQAKQRNNLDQNKPYHSPTYETDNF
jgi:type I restriction-modification system DNA methylase subunit